MKVFRNIVAALLLVAVMAGASAAPVGATGCKVITNPGEASFGNWFWPPTGPTIPMGFSGTLYTGDSSSACNDINIALISNSGICSVQEALVSVQYLSGGVWHDDSQSGTLVPCNSSTLYVIGAGYANNTPFRVLVNVGRDSNGNQGFAWPTFKLYV